MTPSPGGAPYCQFWAALDIGSEPNFPDVVWRGFPQAGDRLFRHQLS